jgi:hypothetical protein
MEFLLPKEQLKGLSAEDQKAVKDEAFNQFLLGSIFGGGGIATGYQAVQNIIPNIQKQRQQQGLLQELGSIQQEFFPTQAQAGQRSFTNQPTRTSADYGPSPEAALRQQQILSAGPDYADLQTRLAKLALNPAAAPIIPSLQSSFGAFKPTITDGVVTNIRNQPTAVIPRADLKSGLQLGGTVQGGNVAFNTSSLPGYGKAVESNLTYALQAGEVPLYDRAGNLVATQPMPGSVENLRARKRAEAEAGAFGIPEQVVNPITQQKEFRSRADILGLTTPAGARGATGGVGGGAVSELSPAQQAVNLATSNRYNEFTKTALDAALTVGDRKTSAEYLYNASNELDPNKLTEFFATGAAYMRAIPGVGDKFDSLVGNVNLLNKTRSEGVLKGLSNIKGNANAFEGGIVDKATTGVTDPKFVTKYVSALEIAAADKDDARQRFIDAYTGDPKAIYTAWSNSPDNPRIYNHPKVNQFLNEQIAANPSKPVLPSGFQLVQSKSGKYGIKKPDGTVMPVGQ